MDSLPERVKTNKRKIEQGAPDVKEQEISPLRLNEKTSPVVKRPICKRIIDSRNGEEREKDINKKEVLTYKHKIVPDSQVHKKKKRKKALPTLTSYPPELTVVQV